MMSTPLSMTDCHDLLSTVFWLEDCVDVCQGTSCQLFSITSTQKKYEIMPQMALENPYLFYRWSNWLWLMSTLPKHKLHDQHIKYLDVWVWHQLLEPWCRILNVTLKFYPYLPIWTSNQYLKLAWIELGYFGTGICSMKALKDIAICQFSIEFWHHLLLFEQGLAHH